MRNTLINDITTGQTADMLKNRTVGQYALNKQAKCAEEGKVLLNMENSRQD